MNSNAAARARYCDAPPASRKQCLGLGVLEALFCGFYVLTLLLSVAQVRGSLSAETDKHRVAIKVALCSVLLTAPLSVFHIFQHLAHFLHPHLQSQVVRIIWMVPVYAVQSLLSLVYIEYSFVFQAIREAYEAYVIYCFMRYLLYFLGERGQLEEQLAAKPASFGKHTCPFCCLRPWAMGADFLGNCKFGVFQYVVLRFTTTVVVFALRYLGMYEEGTYAWNSAATWVTTIDMCSQTWALYTLFLFYHATHKELAPLKPFAKFMCIKTVVFFSWWQALVIGILVQQGAIEGLEEQHSKADDPMSEYTHVHSAQEVADGIQELLICMEMVVAAIAFYFAFPASEYSEMALRDPPTSSGASAPLLRRRSQQLPQQQRQLGKSKRSEANLWMLDHHTARADSTFTKRLSGLGATESSHDVSRELLLLEMQTGMDVSHHLEGAVDEFGLTQRVPPRSDDARPGTPTVLEALWASSIPAELKEDLRALGATVVDEYLKPGPRWLYRKWLRTRSQMVSDVES